MLQLHDKCRRSFRYKLKVHENKVLLFIQSTVLEPPLCGKAADKGSNGTLAKLTLPEKGDREKNVKDY